MDMKEFIQNEYELFLTGKLTFEFILIDSFDYLWKNRWLTVERGQLVTTMAQVTAYRREVLRRFIRNQDRVRQTSYKPVTPEDKRREENKIRKWLVKQSIVYQWYEKKKESGVRKLFLEIPEAV
jgi:hypothetical protein